VGIVKNMKSSSLVSNNILRDIPTDGSFEYDPLTDHLSMVLKDHLSMVLKDHLSSLISPGRN